MLISNYAKPKTGDIVSIRLSTGEEIVGKLLDSPLDYSEVVLEKPVLLHFQQTAAGLDVKFGVPMVSGTTEQVSFFSTALMSRPLPTRENIVTSYKQATSPIITPQTGIIKP